jgi:hypothetical protein
LRSLSDLILALPGETYESHIASIHSLINAGTHEMHNFQAMMLKGSEMDTSRARAQYSFQTRFRLLPKNFGIYGGIRVFDMDEVVVATDTMSFDDYLKCRQYHLACSIFWNNSWFEDAVALVRKFGVQPSEWLDAIVESMEADQGPVGRMVEQFVAETVQELFESREACIAFYSEEKKFERLLHGEIGDNLMYKYRALASFWEWPAICHLAMTTTERLLRQRGAHLCLKDFPALWGDFNRYEELKHAHGRSEEDILSPATVKLSYDVRRWLSDGMPSDLGPYALIPPQTFRFQLSDESIHELRSALKVWTNDLLGLTKMVTRIRHSALVRACHVSGAGRRTNFYPSRTATPREYC